jgi:hypothetical protein
MRATYLHVEFTDFSHYSFTVNIGVEIQITIRCGTIYVFLY